MSIGLAQPCLWDDSQVIPTHQQNKQGEGKAYPHCKHFDGAIRLTFVLDEIVECAGKAGENEDDEQQGKNAHERDHSRKPQFNWIAVSMHWLNLTLGKWKFAPSFWPSVAALFFLVLTLWLGNWQLERANSKRALQAHYDAALEEPPIHIGSTLLARDSVLYRRVEVVGEFDDAHSILLDNRVNHGVAGYHVLTPFKIQGGQLAILVNRGWVATGQNRDNLPETPSPQGIIKLEGVASDPHSRYVELIHGASEGRVWQNLDFDRFSAGYGYGLQPVFLLQTSLAEDGLVRNWPRPDMGVSMHVSYAFQWYSLAATLIVLWLGLNIKRHRDDDR